MKESKWIVKIEDVKYHVWAKDEADAIAKALDIAVIKAYPYEQMQALQKD